MGFFSTYFSSHHEKVREVREPTEVEKATANFFKAILNRPKIKPEVMSRDDIISQGWLSRDDVLDTRQPLRALASYIDKEITKTSRSHTNLLKHEVEALKDYLSEGWEIEHAILKSTSVGHTTDGIPVDLYEVMYKIVDTSATHRQAEFTIPIVQANETVRNMLEAYGLDPSKYIKTIDGVQVSEMGFFGFEGNIRLSGAEFAGIIKNTEGGVITTNELTAVTQSNVLRKMVKRITGLPEKEAKLYEIDRGIRDFIAGRTIVQTDSLGTLNRLENATTLFDLTEVSLSKDIMEHLNKFEDITGMGKLMEDLVKGLQGEFKAASIPPGSQARLQAGKGNLGNVRLNLPGYFNNPLKSQQDALEISARINPPKFMIPGTKKDIAPDKAIEILNKMPRLGHIIQVEGLTGSNLYTQPGSGGTLFHSDVVNHVVARSQMGFSDDTMLLLARKADENMRMHVTTRSVQFDLGPKGTASMNPKIREILEEATEYANKELAAQSKIGKSLARYDLGKDDTIDIKKLLSFDAEDRSKFIHQVQAQFKEGEKLYVGFSGEIDVIKKGDLSSSLPDGINVLRDISVSDAGKMQLKYDTWAPMYNEQTKGVMVGVTDRNIMRYEMYDDGMVSLATKYGLEGERDYLVSEGKKIFAEMRADSMKDALLKPAFKGGHLDVTMLYQDAYKGNIKEALKDRGIRIVGDTFEFDPTAVDAKAASKASYEQLGALLLRFEESMPTARSVKALRKNKLIAGALDELSGSGINIIRTQDHRWGFNFARTDLTQDSVDVLFKTTAEQQLTINKVSTRLLGLREGLFPTFFIRGVQHTDTGAIFGGPKIESGLVSILANIEGGDKILQGIVQAGVVPTSGSGLDSVAAINDYHSTFSALSGDFDKTKAIHIKDIELPSFGGSAIKRRVFYGEGIFKEGGIVDLGRDYRTEHDEVFRYLSVPKASDSKMLDITEAGTLKMDSGYAKSLYEFLEVAKRDFDKAHIGDKEIADKTAELFREMGKRYMRGGEVHEAMFSFRSAGGVFSKATEAPVSFDFGTVAKMIKADPLEQLKYIKDTGKVLPTHFAVDIKFAEQLLQKQLGSGSATYTSDEIGMIKEALDALKKVSKSGESTAKFMSDYTDAVDFVLSRQPVIHHGEFRNVVFSKTVVLSGELSKRVLGAKPVMEGGKRVMEANKHALPWLGYILGSGDFDADTINIIPVGKSGVSAIRELQKKQEDLAVQTTTLLHRINEKAQMLIGESQVPDMQLLALGELSRASRAGEDTYNLLTAKDPYAMQKLIDLSQVRSKQMDELLKRINFDPDNMVKDSDYVDFLQSITAGMFEDEATKTLMRQAISEQHQLAGVATKKAWFGGIDTLSKRINAMHEAGFMEGIDREDITTIFGANLQSNIWYKRPTSTGEEAGKVINDIFNRVSRIATTDGLTKEVELITKGMWRPDPSTATDAAIKEYAAMTAMFAGTKGKSIDPLDYTIETVNEAGETVKRLSLEKLESIKEFIDNTSASGELMSKIFQGQVAASKNKDLTAYLNAFHSILKDGTPSAEKMKETMGAVLGTMQEGTLPGAGRIAQISHDVSDVPILSKLLDEQATEKALGLAGKVINTIKDNPVATGLVVAASAIGLMALGSSSKRKKSPHSDVQITKQHPKSAVPESGGQQVVRGVDLPEGGMDVRGTATPVQGTRLQQLFASQQMQGQMTMVDNRSSVDPFSMTEKVRRSEMYGF